MRKLLLLCAMACVGLLAFAPAAFAETEEPENPVAVPGDVNEEVSGDDCPSVERHDHGEISGGCVIIATSDTSIMVGHSIFGESTLAVCGNEFTGHVDGNGEGWIDMDQIEIGAADEAGGTGNCGDDPVPVQNHYQNNGGTTGVDKCSEEHAEDEDHPGDWHIQGYEDDHGDLWMDVEICLENVPPFGDTITGHLWVRVVENTNHHVMAFEAEDHRLRNVHGTSNHAEFNGHWLVEEADSDQVEIAH